MVTFSEKDKNTYIRALLLAKDIFSIVGFPSPSPTDDEQTKLKIEQYKAKIKTIVIDQTEENYFISEGTVAFLVRYISRYSHEDAIKLQPIENQEKLRQLSGRFKDVFSDLTEFKKKGNFDGSKSFDESYHQVSAYSEAITILESMLNDYSIDESTPLFLTIVYSKIRNIIGMHLILLRISAYCGLDSSNMYYDALNEIFTCYNIFITLLKEETGISTLENAPTIETFGNFAKLVEMYFADYVRDFSIDLSTITPENIYYQSSTKDICETLDPYYAVNIGSVILLVSTNDNTSCRIIHNKEQLKDFLTLENIIDIVIPFKSSLLVDFYPLRRRNTFAVSKVNDEDYFLYFEGEQICIAKKGTYFINDHVKTDDLVPDEELSSQLKNGITNYIVDQIKSIIKNNGKQF